MNQKNWKELEETISSDYDNIIGVVVLKNGEAIYKNYFRGYTVDNAPHVFSVTKSVPSALIGIAIDQGYVDNADRKVLDFFPDHTVKGGEKTIQRVTIRHSLIMIAPYKYQTGPYEMFFISQNPIRDASDLLGGEKAIGEFNYSATGGTHILSGILVKATGQPILDFATKNLLSPPGIRVPHNVVLRNKEEYFAVTSDKNTNGWVADPQGINTAGWGLLPTPEGMVKAGQLYSNGGMRDQKQTVPAEWITGSTREHSRCAQWGNLSHGYLWRIIDDKEHTYVAMGDGGNVIYVNAEKKVVVSIASTFIPDAKGWIELIKKDIEPMFEDCKS